MFCCDSFPLPSGLDSFLKVPSSRKKKGEILKCLGKEKSKEFLENGLDPSIHVHFSSTNRSTSILWKERIPQNPAIPDYKFLV